MKSTIDKYSFIDPLTEGKYHTVGGSQVYAVLRPLFERMALHRAGIDHSGFSATPNTCPNCGAEVQNKRSPYCSEHCKETAAFVRQFRAAVNDGSILEPEKQAVMGQRLWAVTVGGYPLRQALVPPKVVAKVIEREGGRCQVCGAPATEIDHAGSG